MAGPPGMLVLGARDVRTVLPMAACIDVMERAFLALAEGRAALPARTSLPVGPAGETMLVMPAAVGAPGEAHAFGAKLLSLYAANAGTPFPTIQGVVVLFEGTHGSVAAVLDAATLTAVRTAAVSGLATRLLARRDAARLGVVGAGVQARSHLGAITAVRPIRHVAVWSRSRERAAEIARLAEGEHGTEASVATSAREAVEGADIVCTVTAATTPVLDAEWIAPGAHVNAVGAHRPTARELDSATVARARLFVDLTDAALAEAGDVLIPLAEGRITRAHLRGDLPDLVTGRVPGRTSEGEVTVFKSVGLAVEDIAAAGYAYRRAIEAGVGTRVPQ